MELGASVAEALLASAQGTEVLGGLGDDIIEELEVDAARAGWMVGQGQRDGGRRGGEVGKVVVWERD